MQTQVHPLARAATLTKQAREALNRNGIMFQMQSPWALFIGNNQQTWSLAVFLVFWPRNIIWSNHEQQIIHVHLQDAVLFLSYGDQNAPVYIDVLGERSEER